jgi:hypothetical protein
MRMSNCRRCALRKVSYNVVAAGIRRPPVIIGDGISTIEQLIERKSKQRIADTVGSIGIPIDDETKRCIKDAGIDGEQVRNRILEEGRLVQVRKNANLHTGGTMEDVTDNLSPELRKNAIDSALKLETPLVGLDYQVPEINPDEFALIEANERVGLAKERARNNFPIWTHLAGCNARREEKSWRAMAMTSNAAVRPSGVEYIGKLFRALS